MGPGFESLIAYKKRETFRPLFFCTRQGFRGPLFSLLRKHAPYGRLAALRDRSHPPGSPQYEKNLRFFATQVLFLFEDVELAWCGSL